jgi:hypothetical protein
MQFKADPEAPPISPILSDPYEVGQRLAEFGLVAEAFIIAANRGLAAWLETTLNDPPTFPGTAAWAATTRALREELIRSQWGTRLNEMNVPLVVNEAKTMAIAVASGDDETGQAGGSPGTRSPKGRATAEAVRENYRQDRQALFGFMIPPEAIESTRVAGRVTWLFLIHRDMKTRELRYELSRPTSIAEDGYVDGWAERLIFEASPFGGDGVRIKGENGSDGDNGQSPEIIVEIRKLG